MIDTEMVTSPAEPGAEFGSKVKVPVVDPAGTVNDGGTGTRFGLDV
jgi:hypothetical protein